MSRPTDVVPPNIEDVTRALKRAVKANREATAQLLRWTQHLKENFGIDVEIVQGEDTANGAIQEERPATNS